MGAGFGIGLMDRFQRRTRQFKLPAGFQRHIRAVFFQADNLVGLKHRGPAKAVAQPVKQRQNRPGAVIGQRREGIGQIAKLFMLGPDPPFRARLFTRRDIFGQLRQMFNRATAGLRNRHWGGSVRKDVSLELVKRCAGEVNCPSGILPGRQGCPTFGYGRRHSAEVITGQSKISA